MGDAINELRTFPLLAHFCSALDMRCTDKISEPTRRPSLEAQEVKRVSPLAIAMRALSSLRPASHLSGQSS